MSHSGTESAAAKRSSTAISKPSSNADGAEPQKVILKDRKRRKGSHASNRLDGKLSAPSDLQNLLIGDAHDGASMKSPKNRTTGTDLDSTLTEGRALLLEAVAA